MGETLDIEIGVVMTYKDKLEIVLEALKERINKTLRDTWKTEITNRCKIASAVGRNNEDVTAVVDEICNRTIGSLASDFPGVYCKTMDECICHEINLAIRS